MFHFGLKEGKEERTNSLSQLWLPAASRPEKEKEKEKKDFFCSDADEVNTASCSAVASVKNSGVSVA